MNLKWFKSDESLLDEFIVFVLRLKPEEFIGLVTLLNVNMIDEDQMPKTGENLIVEVCSNFVNRPKRQKLKLLKFISKNAELGELPTLDTINDERRADYEKWREEKIQNLRSKEVNTNGTTTEDKNETKN